MAGQSNRNLWQFVTGSSCLHPKILVQEELNRNRTKLLDGLNYFKKPKSQPGDTLKSEKNLDGVQLECVRKISQFLGLDEVQSHDIYCLYLIFEYRGSRQELQNISMSERHLQDFLPMVRDFYFTERLYLLRSMKCIFSAWQESGLQYVDLYSEFVKSLFESPTYITSIVEQYKNICLETAPTWETNGSYMNDQHSSVWLMQNLREQCELLEMMLLYYKSTNHPVDSLYDLCAMFKRQGFGYRQVNRHLLDEVMEPLLARIGFLQTIVLIEGISIEDLCERAPEDMLKHPVVQSKVFPELDRLIQSLEESAPHGCLALLWATLHQLVYQGKSSAVIRKCGNKAIQLGVFTYIKKMLETEPFNGNGMIGRLCHSVVYGLIYAVLQCFDEQTLGDSEGLIDVSALVLKRSFLAEDFWERGQEDGLGTLLHSASLTFPLKSRPLVTLSRSLGEADRSSAQQMIGWLQRLPVFTEHLAKGTGLTATANGQWILVADRRRYSTESSFVIKKGTVGDIVKDEDPQIIQWHIQCDAFDVFIGEVNTLLKQVACGANSIHPLTLRTVLDLTQVLHSLLSVDAILVQEVVPQLWAIVTLLYQTIHRFCQLPCPPLDLLSCCLEVFAQCAKLRPAEVWHNVQQTGFLPYLTENLDSISDIALGVGLNKAYWGQILAGLECTHGTYPVTVATLKLLSHVVQPLLKIKDVDTLMACVLFVCRELFPAFGRWRYYTVRMRSTVGQLCLNIFHNILSLLPVDGPPVMGSRIGKFSLKDVTVHCLLYTESGRTLLDIISLGVAAVEQSLTLQSSSSEGVGSELIELLRLSFSLLNRLLMLRPDNAAKSPVEEFLSSQPCNRSSRHVVAIIAQYMYHRHDSRLPSLAIILLRRIAMLFPMSVLGCLGSDAEPFRDICLTRLQAYTEDVRLKVAILELLAVCVDTQPGLLEIFLNLSLKPLEKGVSGSQDWSIGKQSCLQTVRQLLEAQKQGTYYCPAELLCAVTQFVLALWRGRRHTAMAVLREKEDFWPSLCLSLTRDLPQLNEESSGNKQTLLRELESCACIMHIMALELYSVYKIDKTLEDVVNDLASNNRLLYWSEYVLSCLQCSHELNSGQDALAEHPSLQLLLAWRNIILVLSNDQALCDMIQQTSKETVLRQILSGISGQFTGEHVSPLNIKLASIGSAFYLTLMHKWSACISDCMAVLSSLELCISRVCSTCDDLLPSTLIGLLGVFTCVLQTLRNTKQFQGVEGHDFGSIVSQVSHILKENSNQLMVKPDPKVHSTNLKAKSDSAVHLKLQLICVCLLQEVVILCTTTDSWFPALAHSNIMEILLQSIQPWIQARQGSSYVEALLMLFLSMSKYPGPAETITRAGLTHSLCLPLTVLHRENTWKTTNPTETLVSIDADVWRNVFRLALTLHSSLLAMLRYNFLQEAFNFIGVHLERLVECQQNVGNNLSIECLREALATCQLLYEATAYRREWCLHIPVALRSLKVSLCSLTQRCVALISRPRLLQQLVEKSAADTGHISGPLTDTLSTHLTRRLSQQSSTDDLDSMSPEVLVVQQLLLEILSVSIATLQRFSPELCQVLLDQSLDISDYEVLLDVCFGLPTMDQTLPQGKISFGTLISCATFALRLLTKGDGKGSSPIKNQQESQFLARSSLTYILENSMTLLMSQTVCFLREPTMSERDKQLFKREVGAELSSIVTCIQRMLRKTPSSPSSSTLSTPRSLSSHSLASTLSLASQDADFLKVLHSFVEEVLK